MYWLEQALHMGRKRIVNVDLHLATIECVASAITCFQRYVKFIFVHQHTFDCGAIPGNHRNRRMLAIGKGYS